MSEVFDFFPHHWAVKAFLCHLQMGNLQPTHSHTATVGAAGITVQGHLMSRPWTKPLASHLQEHPARARTCAEYGANSRE